MEEIVTEILDALNVYADEEIKKKHGKSPALTYYDFVSRVISTEGSVSKDVFPEYGEQTINRFIKTAFPNVILSGGGLTWSHYLLSLIKHKKCFKCVKIKKYEEFNVDNEHCSGIRSECKDCRNAFQRGTWKKYEHSHRKSYEKNAGKIKARNAEYRSERLKRVVPWTEHKDIENFYYNCPEGYHVDHILPFKGSLVSGLHVLGNLQYLPAAINIAKSNKIDLQEYNARLAKLVETHQT